MGQTLLNEITLKINNQADFYVPGSVRFSPGVGTDSTIVQQNGNIFETILVKDQTTRIGKVMFDVIPTVENILLLFDWKNRGNTNSIEVSNPTAYDAAGVPTGTTTFSYTSMAIITDPEATTGPNATTSVEFEGEPATVVQI
jgi:hypothetical protein